jgi:putative membrane protein
MILLHGSAMEAWWWPHMWAWMWVLPLTFLVLCLIFLLAYLFRGNGFFCGRRDRRMLGEAAREILDRRYASGEISKEQYEEMKRVLAN